MLIRNALYKLFNYLFLKVVISLNRILILPIGKTISLEFDLLTIILSNQITVSF